MLLPIDLPRLAARGGVRRPRVTGLRVAGSRVARLRIARLRIARLQTSAGPMLAAFTSRGLAALERGDDLQAFSEALVQRHAGNVEGGGDHGLTTQLDEYFDGARRAFDVRLDLSAFAAFDRRVLRAAVAIPYGETRTYGELAAQLGHPRAARAVGNALSRCPFTIVVPCHRVVRASDGLSGWGANLVEKRRLLEFEHRSVSTTHR
jgi:O-6-methylguanine DNA methyltransferase